MIVKAGRVRLGAHPQLEFRDGFIEFEVVEMVERLGDKRIWRGRRRGEEHH
jgi:hypothetical protein